MNCSVSYCSLIIRTQFSLYIRNLLSCVVYNCISMCSVSVSPIMSSEVTPGEHDLDTLMTISDGYRSMLVGIVLL